MIKTLKPLISLLFIFQLSFAQEQVISGNITDSTGVPLNGVTIVLDGTSTGVISDFDGNYLISARQGDVLKYSYLGMKTQMITVGASTKINVVMIEDIESLDAIVITGFQNVQRELFTGASQAIKANKIKLDTILS